MANMGVADWRCPERKSFAVRAVTAIKARDGRVRCQSKRLATAVKMVSAAPLPCALIMGLFVHVWLGCVTVSALSLGHATTSTKIPRSTRTNSKRRRSFRRLRSPPVPLPSFPLSSSAHHNTKLPPVVPSPVSTGTAPPSSIGSLHAPRGYRMRGASLLLIVGLLAAALGLVRGAVVIPLCSAMYIVHHPQTIRCALLKIRCM